MTRFIRERIALIFAWIFCATLIVFGAIAPESAIGNEVIRLATYEREPYINKHLAEQGYAGELITSIFKRKGYDAQFVYVPFVRAVAMLESGTVDGLFPVYGHELQSHQFLFSDPFPGGQIGMLIRKNWDLAESNNMPVNYAIGTIRGAGLPNHFEDRLFSRQEHVATDLQNIVKLINGRIDIAIIDKYTAADIITNKLPHLIGKLEFIDMGTLQNDFHVVFQKGKEKSRELALAFNESLQEVIQAGDLDRIRNKHGFFAEKENVDGKIILSIGTVDNPDMTIMQELAWEYERLNPDVRLDWKVLDENTLRKRLSSDLAINDGQFDIMTISVFEIPIWAKRGRLAALPNPDKKYGFEDILPAIRKTLQYNGRLYALPFYGESSMTYYRKDLFKDKGLVMPDHPTYADIEKFASKLHDPANRQYGICLRGKPGWGANMCFFSTMVNTFGGRWFDPSWHATIDSPEWHDALTFYKGLVSQYGPPTTTVNNYTENLLLFKEGSCAIWIDATVAVGSLLNPDLSRVYDKTGFALAPVQVTENGAQWLYTWSLAIPVSSRQQEEAAKFINWATSRDYIELVAKHKGWLAVPPGTRTSTYENENYKSVAPFADFVFKAIKRADELENTLPPSPYKNIQFVEIPEFISIGNGVGQLLEKVLKDEITVGEALKRAQKVTTDMMNESGK